MWRELSDYRNELATRCQGCDERREGSRCATVLDARARAGRRDRAEAPATTGREIRIPSLTRTRRRITANVAHRAPRKAARTPRPGGGTPRRGGLVSSLRWPDGGQ